MAEIPANPRQVRAVLGLGNPGPRYERTRHNAGFLLVDLLRSTAGGSWTNRGNRQEAVVRDPAGPLLVMRPLTFMNLSGEAAEQMLAARALAPSEMLVVADDAAIPAGRLRIRTGGSAGGHRGLLSLCERLGTEDFPRLRVGIGAPPPGVDLAEFVLEPLEAGVWTEFEQTIERATEAARLVLAQGLAAAMNRFNPVAPAGGPPA